MTTTTLKLAGTAKKLLDLATENGWKVTQDGLSFLFDNLEYGSGDDQIAQIKMHVYDGGNGSYLLNSLLTRTGTQRADEKVWRAGYKAKDVERWLVALAPITIRANRIRQAAIDARSEELKAAYDPNGTPLRRAVRATIDALEASCDKAIAEFEAKYAEYPQNAIEWNLESMVVAQAMKAYYLNALRHEGYVRTDNSSTVEDLKVTTLEEHVFDYVTRLLDEALTDRSGSSNLGHRLFADSKKQAATEIVKKLHPLVSSNWTLRIEFQNSGLKLPINDY